MSSEEFFQNLDGFDDFREITADRHFFRAPGDWKVIISDVKGSTRAIEAGKYKDVNTVGAASIVCAQNAIGTLEFPYVFGGDGATMLVPRTREKEVVKALLALKDLSEKKFQLGLRVGVVSVQEIYDEGGVIEVAKYEAIRNKPLAVIRGGGVKLAEHKIKKQNERYEATGKDFGDANLGGLSCRWNPVPSVKGNVLSVLVESRTENEAETYQKVLNAMNGIFSNELDSANPVNAEAMRYKSIGQCLKDERRYHSSFFSVKFFLRFLEIVYAVLVFKSNFPAMFFNAKKYTDSLRTHSDHKKFDDALRLIIDCTEEQTQKIKEYLESLYQSGEIFYGVHVSDESLMTCYVDNVGDGGHIHFIDGGDGGYAMAAKQLKGQIAEAKETKAG